MGQKSVTNKTDMESFKKLVYRAGGERAVVAGNVMIVT